MKPLDAIVYTEALALFCFLCAFVAFCIGSNAALFWCGILGFVYLMLGKFWIVRRRRMLCRASQNFSKCADASVPAWVPCERCPVRWES